MQIIFLTVHVDKLHCKRAKKLNGSGKRTQQGTGGKENKFNISQYEKVIVIKMMQCIIDQRIFSQFFSRYFLVDQ